MLIFPHSADDTVNEIIHTFSPNAQICVPRGTRLSTHSLNQLGDYFEAEVLFALTPVSRFLHVTAARRESDFPWMRVMVRGGNRAGSSGGLQPVGRYVLRRGDPFNLAPGFATRLLCGALFSIYRALLFPRGGVFCAAIARISRTIFI